MSYRELFIDGAELRVYPCGKIERFTTTTTPITVDAGTLDREKYKYISINGRRYRWHRLVYKAFNPGWDINDLSWDNSILHLDGNRQNNCINNLCVFIDQQNRSGITNIRSRYNRHKNSWGWLIVIRRNKKIYRKSFTMGKGQIPDPLPDIPEHIIQTKNDMIRQYQ